MNELINKYFGRLAAKHFIELIVEELFRTNLANEQIYCTK